MKFVLLSLVTTVFIVFGQDQAIPSGKDVFVNNKCQKCHTVSAAGLTSEKKRTIDLSEVLNTYQMDELKLFLQKKGKLNGSKHPKKFKGPEGELDSLLLWLNTLKSNKQSP